MPPIEETPSPEPNRPIPVARIVSASRGGEVIDVSETEPESQPELKPRPRRKRRPPRIEGYVRILLALMALGFTGVLIVAAWLRPYDENGEPLKMATHTQLGMPPCNMVILTGKPCPACGMTTSFSLLAHGDVLASLQANWVGTLLATFCFTLIPWGMASAIRGRLVGLRNAEVTLVLILSALLALMLLRWGWIMFT